MVSKFLVNYLDKQSDHHVRLQILDTLSCILDFTPEDKTRIGLE